MSVRRPPRRRAPPILVIANPTEDSDSDDAATTKPGANGHQNNSHAPPRTPAPPPSAALPPRYTPGPPVHPAYASGSTTSARTSNDASSSSTSTTTSSSSPTPEPATPLVTSDIGPRPIVPPLKDDVYETPTQGSAANRSPVTGQSRLVIMAAVSQHFVVVDITGARSSDFIRERIFSKLQIPDDDQYKYLIFRTEAGEYPTGPPLDHHDLLAMCLRHADRIGTLKFLVLPSATHRQPLHVETDLIAPSPVRKAGAGSGFSPLVERSRDAAAARFEADAERPTSPSPSTGTATLNAHLHGIPRVTTPTPVPQPSADGSWRPPLPAQPHSYGGHPASPSPQNRAQLRTYSGRALPPPPSRPPPAVPSNQQPLSAHAHAQQARGPLSAAAGPSSAGPLRAVPTPPLGQYSTRTPPMGRTTRAVNPHWFNGATPATRLPLGPSPTAAPPPQPHALHPGAGPSLANARSIGDLRSAHSAGRRRRQNSVGDETPSSPYSPAAPPLTAGGTLSPSVSGRPAWSDTEGGTGSTFRRPSHGAPTSPYPGRMMPSPTEVGNRRPPQLAQAVPIAGMPPSPVGQSPEEPTLMHRDYQHILPLLEDRAAQAARHAPQTVPPPTPQPYQLGMPISLSAPAHLAIDPNDSGSDGEDTLWAVKPTHTPQPTPTPTSYASQSRSSPAPPMMIHMPGSPPHSNRPQIKVSINDVEAQLSPFSGNASAGGQLPSAGGSSTGGSPSGATARRARPTSEFYQREGFTWNVRPPMEEVYDQLQRYFPGVDLDKPLVEAPSGANSPVESPGDAVPPLSLAQRAQTTQQAAAAQEQEQVVAVQERAERRARHKKSIRIVANERRKILRESKIITTPGAPVSVVQQQQAAANKRSTKLWDVKVEEVMPSAASSAAAESPTSASAGGRAVNKWIKGDLIGKGTFGKVYLALNVSNGEMIAVKQVELPKTDSDRADTRQTAVVDAIKSESATLRELMHPNVVEYLGFEETSDFFNLFLEYVPGGSIGGVLRKLGKFSEDVCKDFTAQILDGLAYLHSRQVLHRDLKGDNILVDSTGNCKISDFGISKRTDDIYGLDASATNMQGSIFWMAPEVLSNGGQGYSAKIDIWSVGCVYVEMITGHRPWRDEDFVSVMYKVGAGKARPPIPELSPIASEFSSLCFAPDPKDRPIAAELRKHRYLHVPDGWTFSSFQQ